MSGSIELHVLEERRTKTFCFQDVFEKNYIIGLVEFINTKYDPSNPYENMPKDKDGLQFHLRRDFNVNAPADNHTYLNKKTNNAYIKRDKVFENIKDIHNDLRGNVTITTSSGKYSYFECIIEREQIENLKELFLKKMDSITKKNTVSTNDENRKKWKNNEFRTRSHVTVEPTPNNSIRNILIGTGIIVAATMLYYRYNNPEEYTGGTADLSKELEKEIINEDPYIKIGPAMANEIDKIKTTDDLKTFIENGVKNLSPQEKEKYKTIIEKRISREDKKNIKTDFPSFKDDNVLAELFKFEGGRKRKTNKRKRKNNRKSNKKRK